MAAIGHEQINNYPFSRWQYTSPTERTSPLATLTVIIPHQRYRNSVKHIRVTDIIIIT